MICWSDYATCLEALYNRLSKKEIGLFMIFNNIEKSSYGLAQYGDDDIDWNKIASGDWRVVLCMTPTEIWQFMIEPLIRYFPEVPLAGSSKSLPPGE